MLKPFSGGWNLLGGRRALSNSQLHVAVSSHIYIIKLVFRKRNGVDNDAAAGRAFGKIVVGKEVRRAPVARRAQYKIGLPDPLFVFSKLLR
jgi:hypothetical protein